MKKILSIALSTIMAMSLCTAAFADDTTTETLTGTGELEGYIDKEIFSIILPTTTAAAYDYIVDPQQLITDTEGAAISSSTFEEKATLFFANSTDSTYTSYSPSYDYSSTSNPLYITTKSSMAIDVSATATLASSETVSAATSNEFAETDTTPSIYLNLTSDSDSTGAVVTTAGTTLTSELAAVPADCFKVSYASDTDTYSYALDTDVYADDAAIIADTNGYFETEAFYLTGASNPNADWSEITTLPDLTVTWAIAQHSDGPSSVVTSDGSNDIVIYNDAILSTDTVTLTPVSISGSNTAAFSPSDSTKATVADGCVTIKASWIEAFRATSTRGTGTYNVTTTSMTSPVTITIS